jgi:hypothetical protein
MQHMPVACVWLARGVRVWHHLPVACVWHLPLACVWLAHTFNPFFFCGQRLFLPLIFILSPLHAFAVKVPFDVRGWANLPLIPVGHLAAGDGISCCLLGKVGTSGLS